VSDRGTSWRQGTKLPKIVGFSPRRKRRFAGIFAFGLVRRHGTEFSGSSKIV
jgi:hypothetical protein